MSASSEPTGTESLPVGRSWRALDALVAERVMGWSDVNPYQALLNVPGYVGRNSGGDVADVPWYSRDMGPAWQVVDALLARGLFVEMASEPNWHSVSVWRRYHRADKVTLGGLDMPVLICRAALAIVASADQPSVPGAPSTGRTEA